MQLNPTFIQRLSILISNLKLEAESYQIYNVSIWIAIYKLTLLQYYLEVRQGIEHIGIINTALADTELWDTVNRMQSVSPETLLRYFLLSGTVVHTSVNNAAYKG